MRSLNRRAFTLAEMLTSLLLMGAVLGLVTHAIVAQLRFLGGISAVAALRRELGNGVGIVDNLLRDVAAEDIVSAQDSAIQLRTPVGTAAVCRGGVGWLAIAAPSPSGDAIAAFQQTPDAGDQLLVLREDSSGVAWSDAELAEAPAAAGSCGGLGATAWRLATVAPDDFSSARVVRVLRPLRLSLYRAADGRWFLGGRDWNASLGRFNAVQPIAGPLRRYDRDRSRSGLAFSYLDGNGAALPDPVDPIRVAAITVVARAETGGPVRGTGMATNAAGAVSDSVAITVGLRNRP